MKIIGRNPVKEALAAGKTIDRLLVEKGLRDSGAQRIIDDAKSRGVKIFFRDRDALDRECDGVRHQGFVAEVTDFAYCSVDDIIDLAAQRGQDPLIVILDGIEDPHNLGSIIRVAECAGVHGLILPRHRSASVNETVIKVSAGASAHMNIAKVSNINATIEQLKARNFWVYGAEVGGADIFATTFHAPTVLVIGGEGHGIHQLTRKLCDQMVSIPMFGNLNSLNASVACGIALYAIKQNQKSSN